MYGQRGRTPFEEWLVHEKCCFVPTISRITFFLISTEGFMYRCWRYRTKGWLVQKDEEKGRKKGVELVASVRILVTGLEWLRYFILFQNRVANKFKKNSYRIAVMRSLENGHNLMVKAFFGGGVMIGYKSICNGKLLSVA